MAGSLVSSLPQPFPAAFVIIGLIFMIVGIVMLFLDKWEQDVR